MNCGCFLWAKYGGSNCLREIVCVFGSESVLLVVCLFASVTPVGLIPVSPGGSSPLRPSTPTTSRTRTKWVSHRWGVSLHVRLLISYSVSSLTFCSDLPFTCLTPPWRKNKQQHHSEFLTNQALRCCPPSVPSPHVCQLD